MFKEEKFIFITSDNTAASNTAASNTAASNTHKAQTQCVLK